MRCELTRQLSAIGGSSVCLSLSATSGGGCRVFLRRVSRTAAMSQADSMPSANGMLAEALLFGTAERPEGAPPPHDGGGATAPATKPANGCSSGRQPQQPAMAPESEPNEKRSQEQAVADGRSGGGTQLPSQEKMQDKRKQPIAEHCGGATASASSHSAAQQVGKHGCTSEKLPNPAGTAPAPPAPLPAKVEQAVPAQSGRVIAPAASPSRPLPRLQLDTFMATCNMALVNGTTGFVLGDGAEGRVVVAEKMGTGELVAVKWAKKGIDMREVAVLQHLSRPAASSLAASRSLAQRACFPDTARRAFRCDLRFFAAFQLTINSGIRRAAGESRSDHNGD